MHVSNIAERQGYLEIRIEGPYSMRDVPDLVKAVSQAVGRSGGTRLLIHSQGVTGRAPTTVERYDVSMGLLELPKGLRLAMVPWAEVIDPDRFGQTVARNRGLSYAVFEEEAEAVKWLLEEGRDAPATSFR